MPAFVDPLTVHDPATGQVAPAAWGDTVNQDLNALATPPSCRVYNTANLSIPNAASSALTFNAERYDSDSMHSTVSNTNRITCVTAGLYRITANLYLASNATGFREAILRVNGVTQIARDNKMALTGTVTALNPTTEWRLAAGDYVEVLVFQNSGAALNVVAGASETPEFSAVWLSL